MVLIFGCAATPTKPTPEKVPEKAPEKIAVKSPEKIPEKAPEKDPFSVFPEQYRQRAIAYEKSSELPKALQCWEIVKAFEPNHNEAAAKIAGLRKQLQTLADQHFRKGLSHYQNRSVAGARKEFLLTLYYHPDHAEALFYLKNKLFEEDFILYKVVTGDTVREIAKKVYDDPQKEFLIAYFNDLGTDSKLEPEATLRLPVLEVPQSKPMTEPKEGKGSKPIVEPKEPKGPTEAERMMGRAVAYFKANKYKETVALTQDVLSADPSNKEARELTNASYYEMGKRLHERGQYQEALAEFGRMDSGYRDSEQLIAKTKKQFAEVRYISGVKYFTEENLDKAIEEWQETLKLNPQHPKAKGDMENAVRLQEKLKQIK
jgi:tetratricopeptide (TPR) repeat protein